MLEFEPALVLVQGFVQVLWTKKGDVSVSQGKSSVGFSWRQAFLGEKVKRTDETRSIRSRLAVNQQRILASFE